MKNSNFQMNRTKRLAVVIGNSDYESLTSLTNPINDANAVKETLHFLGYKVSLGINLLRSEIIKCLTNVLTSWEHEASEIIVYYSGHGVSIDGKAYIAPVDADNDVPKNLIRESYYSVEAIIRYFLDHRRDDKFPIILILDCCRSKIMSATSYNHNQGDSLQSIEGELGTKSNIAILYSTANGQVALDGNGGSEHSPYTQVLLENIVKDWTIYEINNEITRTLRKSGSIQVSWMYQCLYEPYRFSLPKSPINSQGYLQTPLTFNDTIVRRFYGVPARNYNFIDRPKIISNMEDILTKKISMIGGNILALSGLGGMGKTQLMIQYCYLHHLEYDYTFWLEADGKIMTLDSFQKLAVNLGLDEEVAKEKYSDEKVIDWVCAWLEKKTRWLLLLDNVDEVMATELFKILPRIGGDIILTTREYIPPTKAKMISVYKMDENEALSLLFNARSLNPIDHQSEEYAKKIVIELDSMPLAIVIACAYIDNMQLSFKNYLSILKNQRDEIFSYYDKDNSHQYNHNLTTVWKLSFERIRNLDPVASLILNVCVFLQPDSIPICFFEQQYSYLKKGSTLPSSSSNSENSSKTVRTAISLLVKFSFVTRTLKEDTESGEDSLTMHQLVQDVIFNEMNDEQKVRLACNFVEALNNDIEFSNPYAMTTRKIMNTYLLHIRHFVTQFNELNQNLLLSKHLEKLLVKTADYLLDNGIYIDAEMLAKLALSVSEFIHGQGNLSTIKPLTLLGLSYLKRGIYVDAEPLFQRALVVNEKALGPEHPDTAASLNNLAMLYDNQGKYADAEPLYQRALIVREKALGPEHPDTAWSLNNLAMLYDNQGKYADAEPLYQRALIVMETSLGFEHPDTAAPLNNLALLYNNQGKYADAEPLYQRALIVLEKALGPEHPDTAAPLNNLAMLYHDQGEYADAEPLYQRALIVLEKALGPEHPDTAVSLNNLAILYFNQGKYADAEPLYKRALIVKEKALGPEHPSTVVSLNNLALLYNNQGKYADAEPLYQRVLIVREKVLGPEHPDTAESRNMLMSLQRRHMDLYKILAVIFIILLYANFPDFFCRGLHQNSVWCLQLSQRFKAKPKVWD